MQIIEQDPAHSIIQTHRQHISNKDISNMNLVQLKFLNSDFFPPQVSEYWIMYNPGLGTPNLVNFR